MTTTRRRPARERVIATADRLFYAHGIHAVGVDQIVEEAGVSKASLYANYRTKDDLAVSYLRTRSENWQAHVAEELPGRAEEPRERVLAIFDMLGEWFVMPGYRGCPFINAEAEYGAGTATREVNLEHRAWVRSLFTDLLEEAGVPEAASVALRLVLLYDGSMIAAQVEPQLPWANAARLAAAQVIS
jgi:AcrR family transcriptional regulator